MSRSNYSDDGDTPMSLYRQAVKCATDGRRGQALLRRLLTALDALPQPRLIGQLLREGADVCALGAILPPALLEERPQINDEDYDVGNLERTLNAAPCLLREIVYVNDEEGAPTETPEARFVRVRAWVVSQLKEPQS